MNGKSNEKYLLKGLGRPVSTLLVVALLQCVIGLIYRAFYAGRTDFSLFEWVFVFSAPIYFALAILALRWPMYSILAALATQSFSAEWLHGIRYHDSMFWDGRNFLALTVVLLAWAFVNELRREQTSGASLRIRMWPMVLGCAFLLAVVFSVILLLYVEFCVHLALMALSPSGAASGPVSRTLVDFAVEQIRGVVLLSSLASILLMAGTLGAIWVIKREWRVQAGSSETKDSSISQTTEAIDKHDEKSQ